jgi:xylulokinase
MVRYSVGLDVGTSGLKGLLVNESGGVEATAFAGYEVDRPHPGWSQQDPEDWWQAARKVIRELAAKGLPIGAIGLSGQMHGSVFLDEAGACLSPAILWNDQRTYAECDEIERLTDGRIIDWTLNAPRTAFTASKILWTRKHLPDVWAKTRTVLLPKDYVRFRLTGERLTDVCDASGTNLLDVRNRRWSRAALEALGIPESVLPGLHESPEIAGRVTAAVAADLDIAPGTPVIAGAADQTAAALGNGISEPGAVSITIGTSGVVYAQLDEIKVDPSGAFHTFCHGVPGTWQVMAGVLSAGGSLGWFRDRFADDEAAVAAKRGVDVYDVIFEEIGEIPAGADGLVFLPYLTGERSPHNDPHARGAYFGLTARHDKRHLARATVEGISFALADLVDVLVGLGIEIGEIRVAGGGARSRTWLGILASILGRPVVATTTPDASGYGAALLAMSGLTGRPVAELCRTWVVAGAPVAPDTATADVYARNHEIYRGLYPATRSFMHALSEGGQTR